MFTSRTRTGLAACASLAALGIAAAPAAHAQSSLTLNSGDVVTVSGAGTVGTVKNLPVANNTTAYSSTNYYSVQTNGTAVFTLGNGGSLSTTTGYGLDTEGSGLVTITGGSISAGKGTGLSAGDGSSVLITSGTFSAANNYAVLYAKGNSAVTIMMGGSFTGTLLSGGYSSTIDLYGMFDGLNLGQTKALASGTGSFSGTLQNNTASQTFTYQNSATITLHNTGLIAAAPEPSQFAAFAVGLLGLGALAMKARRRQIAL